MTVFTIGFTKKSAEVFFGLLQNAQVETVIDVRLNSRSQLSGFARQDDLKYFLNQLAGIQYQSIPELAPTSDILKAYRHKELSWDQYQRAFMDLMAQRKIETILTPEALHNSCLLCSEHKPHQCHRMLILDYLNQHWNTKFQVEHLF